MLSEGRELSTEAPKVKSPITRRRSRTVSLRAFLPQVQTASALGASALVTCAARRNSRAKFCASRAARDLPAWRPRAGRAQHPVGEGGERRRHVQIGRRTRQLYASEGVDGSKPVIAYCRIGERSSHTWFVLKYLLGFRDRKELRRMWTEWGNLVGAGVERGAAAKAAGRADESGRIRGAASWSWRAGR